MPRWIHVRVLSIAVVTLFYLEIDTLDEIHDMTLMGRAILCYSFMTKIIALNFLFFCFGAIIIENGTRFSYN